MALIYVRGLMVEYHHKSAMICSNASAVVSSESVDMTRTMACDVEFWNTFDPTIVEGTREQRLAAYREVRDFLNKKIRERFAKR